MYRSAQCSASMSSVAAQPTISPLQSSASMRHSPPSLHYSPCGASHTSEFTHHSYLCVRQKFQHQGKLYSRSSHYAPNGLYAYLSVHTIFFSPDLVANEPGEELVTWFAYLATRVTMIVLLFLPSYNTTRTSNILLLCKQLNKFAGKWWLQVQRCMWYTSKGYLDHKTKLLINIISAEKRNRGQGGSSTPYFLEVGRRGGGLSPS